MIRMIGDAVFEGRAQEQSFVWILFLKLPESLAGNAFFKRRGLQLVDRPKKRRPVQTT